jgi:enoyl-CoA hydratase/carnithine racemase
MDEKILSRVDGAVGRLTFNNPQRHNAMSLEMWREATAKLEVLACNAAARVIVLTGAGGKAFVSGADISKFESERSSADGIAVYNAATERFSQTLLDCPQATVAMIRGYCIGGGLGIAVACDLRVAAEHSRFGVPAAKLGLGYSLGNLRRLVNLMGPQFTAEMLFTARQFEAAEAARIGLINHLVPDAEIESYVWSIAETIAGNAPLTIRATKAILHELERDAAERDSARCEALVKACFASEDYREGSLAFLEKRKPVFTGK